MTIHFNKFKNILVNNMYTQMILHILKGTFLYIIVLMLMLQMYYIIFFENWCSIVPNIWVNLKERTFKWPPKNENVRTAIIKRTYPNEKWSALQYRRIAGPYSNYIFILIIIYLLLYYNEIYLLKNINNLFIETYDIARKKEKEAEVISTSDEVTLQNFNSTSPMKQSTKRKIRRPQFHDEIEESQTNSKLYSF